MMAKKKEPNPVDAFNSLIRDSALKIEKGMDSIFNDVAKGAEPIIGHLDPLESSEDSEEKKN